MKPVNRPYVPAALCAVLSVLFAVPAAQAATTPTLRSSPASTPVTAADGAAQVAAAVPRLDWRSCGPGLTRYRCATAEVPMDYDDPTGPKTRLAVTKLPASGPASERIGALFTNPGGPGGSGVDFVQRDALSIYSPAVLERYDILGFDPRGVVRSDPATCFRTQAEEESSPTLRSFYPLPGPQEASYTEQALRLAVRCQTTSPRRFSTGSTANVARDMDLLRQAVGEQKLAYAGYSYGTFLGATYARLFPGRVGRFVLDATVDPVAWSGTGTGDASARTPFGIRARQGIGATETLAEFVRLCRAGGSATCSLAALGDPAVVMPSTFDRLARHPLTVTLPDGTKTVITQQLAVMITFLSLYSPSAWPELADFLAAIAAPVPSPARVLAAAARTRSPLGARLRGEDYPSIGGGMASLCVDTAASRRVLEYPALIAASDVRSPYFGRARGWVVLPCEFWALRDPDAFHGPWQQQTQAPVLVIGTRFDPATPYRQTRPYADLFPAARMLTLNGWGHTAIGKSACADAAVTTYLVVGTPPRDGTVCAPDAVPFAATAGDRQAAPRPDVPSGLPLW